MNTAIGDDFHSAIGEQQVHQHSAVAFGVPDAQAPEHVERAFARCLPGEHQRQRQRGLYHEAHLTRVTALAGADRGLNTSQCLARKCLAHRTVIGCKVACKAFQARRRRLCRAMFWRCIGRLHVSPSLRSHRRRQSFRHRRRIHRHRRRHRRQIRLRPGSSQHRGRRTSKR